VHCSEVDGAASLSAHQWSIADNIVQLLAPFEECTREVSGDTARISLVIPLVEVLRNILSREVANDAGIKSLFWSH